MKQPTPISATEMHKRRGELLRRCVVSGEHFLIVKDGIPVAVLLPIRDYRRTNHSA